MIANRGEIARRIIRTCRRLGIETVAVYSTPDREAPYVREADQAYHLPGTLPSETYLNQEKLLEVAERAKVEAIHPGYGFLAENATFARAVAERFIFIGPHADAIEQMGSKSAAKALAQKVGVPTLPGWHEPGARAAAYLAEAKKMGFPVLLKAVAGGGGKGMRIVERAEDFLTAFEAAAREAQNAFGNPELLLERYFPSARHIEVQILGDKHGNLVHLFERDCTIQRRYQKVLEETPSPVLSDSNRQAMTEAALCLGRALAYDNAGTVEFLWVAPGEFFFLEVNTRLQVEHPVTEAVLGLDLVEWQIRVAAGERLNLPELRPRGHAIEVRLTAEDPFADDRPASGRIPYWHVPELPYLRVDAGYEAGQEVPPYYDSLLAKVIVWGPTRAEAVQRLRYALSQIVILGLPTNLPLLARLCLDADFEAGQFDTHFLAKRPALRNSIVLSSQEGQSLAAALSTFRLLQVQEVLPLLQALPAGWRNLPQKALPYAWELQGQTFAVNLREIHSRRLYHYRDPAAEVWEALEVLSCQAPHFTYEAAGLRQVLTIIQVADDTYEVHLPSLGRVVARTLPRFPTAAQQTEKGAYLAPMPGQISRLFVKPGEAVSENQPLLVLLSMKMENTIYAHEAGTVQAVFVEEGQTVTAGTELLQIQPES